LEAIGEERTDLVPGPHKHFNRPTASINSTFYFKKMGIYFSSLSKQDAAD
jgi:hypothetical protein